MRAKQSPNERKPIKPAGTMQVVSRETVECLWNLAELVPHGTPTRSSFFGFHAPVFHVERFLGEDLQRMGAYLIISSLNHMLHDSKSSMHHFALKLHSQFAHDWVDAGKMFERLKSARPSKR